MAFFSNLFKRKTEAPEEKKPEQVTPPKVDLPPVSAPLTPPTQQPTPKPEIPKQSIPAPNLEERKVVSAPVTSAEIPVRKDPAKADQRPPYPARQQNQTADRPIYISGLLHKDRKIVFDSSSINCTGFSQLIADNEERIKGYAKSLFIPKFEISLLTGESRAIAQKLVADELFSLFQYDQVEDYASLLQRIAPMGKEKGRLCFVANSDEKRRNILFAAKNAGVFVQFFIVDEHGQLRSPMRQNPPEPRREPQSAYDRQTRPPYAGERQTRPYNPAPIAKDTFTIASMPERMRVLPIVLKSPLIVGSTVYNSGNEAVTLLKQEIVNPNSITYSTNIPNVWAKIYNQSALNTFLEEKNKRMISKKVECKGLCWPTDVLHNADGQFVGALVPPSKGEPLHLAVFKQAKLQTYFPSWNKKDLCDLTVTILRVIQYLHSMNILMGCINPAAIRVVSKDEVYFVDTDNYQVEGFPTLVYNVSFTPPELQGRRLYLCKKENENYAIAVLVFMLMMPGKTPYTVDPNKSAQEAIAEKKFPFSNGTVHGDHAMPGMWRFMWSHMTPLKDPFFNTFQKDAKFERPEDRRTVSNWIGTILRFREELENPVDPESLKLYPRTFKRGKTDTFHTCKKCGVAHPEFYFNRRYFEEYRICNSCIDRRSDVSFTCKACGKTYYYTNRTALFHASKKKKDSEWKDQKYCRDCKNKTLPCLDCGEIKPYYYLRNGRCSTCNDKVYSRNTCRDCGNYFTITVGDHEFNRSKGFSDPVRCKSCRDKRKNNRY